MRENAASKGRRYLAEGRLVIRLVNPSEITATCRGGGAMYALGWRRGEGWWCGCAARSLACCHLLALQLGTAPGTPALRLAAGG
jgi:hypothetical protein